MTEQARMSIPNIAEAAADEGPAMPVHVGIIMDGNGRWAAARGLPRIEGHRRGVEALRRTVRNAGELGVKVLTIYSFSTENWSRPKQEVSDLMSLFKRFVREDLAELHRAGVRVMMIGEREGLDAEILKLVGEAETLTRENDKLTLAVAFNYGGRQEIARAAQRIAEEVAAGKIDPGKIDADTMDAHLDTAGLPDPDLIIRTSGELRLSNFLLWQSAYAEFVVLPVHWPDFDRAALEQALEEFRRRKRRFGGLEARARA
jgi:undecaprenyl diphosphate synthase